MGKVIHSPPEVLGWTPVQPDKKHFEAAPRTERFQTSYRLPQGQLWEVDETCGPLPLQLGNRSCKLGNFSPTWTRSVSYTREERPTHHLVLGLLSRDLAHVLSGQPTGVPREDVHRFGMRQAHGWWDDLLLAQAPGGVSSSHWEPSR
jgi:hypothetical protein